MVLEPTSKMAMKTEAITHVRMKMVISGKKADSSSGDHHLISHLEMKVVRAVMRNLARKMNTSAIPSTKPNFTEFFNIMMKASMAEWQKLLLVMAM
jgi:hypothetical protein